MRLALYDNNDETYLNLVHSRCDSCSLHDGVEMLWQEVRYSNRLCFARCLHIFHSLPGLLEFYFVLTAIREERGVDEVACQSKSAQHSKLAVRKWSIQINVVQLQFLQARINSRVNIRHIRDDFGRHEKLVTRYTTLFDSSPKLGFGLVYLGAIKMVVPHLPSRYWLRCNDYGWIGLT